MFRIARLSRLAILSACLLLLLTAPAFAEIIYTATIDGPTAGTSSAATGTATFTLNDAGTEVSYVVEMTGLEGFETGAHIHNAAPGSAGPRFHTFLLGSPKVGVWSVGEFELDELNAERVYVNVHSDLFPTGEIRGNLEFSAVGTDEMSWGAIKALYQ
jgi:hypothetical protein